MKLAKPRLHDAVHAHVGDAQGEALAHRGCDARPRPDGFRFLDRERGQIRLDKYLESRAPFLRRWERADALFQFPKALQSVENPAPQIRLGFRVSRRCHDRQHVTKYSAVITSNDERCGNADFEVVNALISRSRF